tara:strand:- start:22239 stop:24857 length:2619 start_codon:yes stop_codon:yes gene_type:complete
MDRVLLGKKVEQSFSTSIISYTPSDAGSGAGGLPEGFFATVVLNETNIEKIPLGAFIKFPAVSSGEDSETKQILSPVINNDGFVEFEVFGLKHPDAPGLGFLNNSLVGDVVNYWQSLGLQAEISSSSVDDYGMWVSKPTQDVLDPVTAQGANLSFDSAADFGTLRVLQTGTFQIQCKKTFMGKKGALEIGSDEQMRANADYTKLYPFELDVIDDFNEYYSTLPKNANVALYGFGEGEVPLTGNAFNHQYVQNVYCDYGTQTIEFNPPLPDHVKTPHISVFFAVGNSSGHFHPWYANVECNDSDYEWQYANSQHCVHMDSAWFRGKWTFRERTVAPFGTNVNEQFPSILETAPGYFGGQGPIGSSILQNENNYMVDDGAGVIEPFGVSPTARDDHSYPRSSGSFVNGPTWDTNSIEREQISYHKNISYNIGDTDLNSPTSLWGGMLKSFAGLQGLSYFANNTHLKLDAFMTPTHTPTPFETEIVKTRVANPDSGSLTADDFDTYGNFKKNVGMTSDVTGLPTYEYDTHRGTAFERGYGLDYKEQLPRKFRTKYWDGSETEYEWWPIGHANGHFTIAKATDSEGGDITDANRATVKAMMQQEANDMADAGEISSNRVQYGTVGHDGSSLYIPIPDEYPYQASPEIIDAFTFPLAGGIYEAASPYIAAAYGDYRIIKEMGNTMFSGTPFITVVNKGTRFPNQLPDTEAKNYPPNSQYEPGDAFLKTRTFQGQPTSLDSFWNSFSNNMSQWVSSNTPYGEFYYADGGYASDHSPYFNYGGGIRLYAAEKVSVSDAVAGTDKFVKIIPSDWNVQRQSFQKHNWHGGNPKAGVGTEGRRFGFGGAGSAEALGGEGEGVFDTYYGKYIVYDIEGGDTDA